MRNVSLSYISRSCFSHENLKCAKLRGEASFRDGGIWYKWSRNFDWEPKSPCLICLFVLLSFCVFVLLSFCLLCAFRFLFLAVMAQKGLQLTVGTTGCSRLPGPLALS